MNKQFWHRNASTVLTCLGGARVVVTSVMAVKATPKALKKNRNCRTRERRTTVKMGESENRWTKLRTSSDDRCGNCHVRHWCESCNKPQTGKYRRCLRSGKRVLQTVSKQSKRDLR